MAQLAIALLSRALTLKDSFRINQVIFSFFLVRGHFFSSGFSFVAVYTKIREKPKSNPCSKT